MSSLITQPSNRLTLAVAGSRKTQRLMDSCKEADPCERVLVLTYTSTNQAELSTRLRRLAGDHPHIEVGAWFSFLLQNFVHPFLSLMFPGRRVEGFDFDSPPQTYTGVGIWSRYVNEHGEVRHRHLPELAVQINAAGNGIWPPYPPVRPTQLCRPVSPSHMSEKCHRKSSKAVCRWMVE